MKIKKNRIVAVGSIAKDSIETPFGKVENTVGGSSVYFSLAASFFAPVAIIGVIGDDFPDGFLKELSKRKIDVSGIEKAEGKTFLWKGKYSRDLSTAETLDTQLNVFQNFSPKIPAPLLSSKFLFLANIDPVLQMKVLNEMKKNNGCFVAGDTMNYWIENRKKALERIIPKLDALMINEAEIREFTSQHNIIKAAKSILSKGVKIVVVKKGEYGVSCFTKNGMFFLPAFPLENAVDPTGAGDSFAGGFMGYIAKTGNFTWQSIRKAIAYGTVMSSFTVSGFGVKRLLSLRPQELKKRYGDFVKMVHFEKIRL